MIKKLLTALGLGIAASTPTPAAEPLAPYRESHINFLYNLLFCDDPSLFRSSENGAPWDTLLAEKANTAALQALAKNETEKSRVRILAYNRLRTAGVAVPPKKLLGVIVEVPLEQGLDVLAAYADGRVRYLNQSGKVGIFEGTPPQVTSLARELVTVSQNLVNKIGPWEKQRLPPPRQGNVRMTFLVSDGLYFGEGAFQALQKDAMGGPILAKAGQLLQAAVAAGTQ